MSKYLIISKIIKTIYNMINMETDYKIIQFDLFKEYLNEDIIKSSKNDKYINVNDLKVLNNIYNMEYDNFDIIIITEINVHLRNIESKTVLYKILLFFE